MNHHATKDINVGVKGTSEQNELDAFSLPFGLMESERERKKETQEKHFLHVIILACLWPSTQAFYSFK